jgi:hypothetical protein
MYSGAPLRCDGFRKALLTALLSALLATAIFGLLTAPAEFTFMADDFGYLAGAYELETLYSDRLLRFLPRVPVWSFVAWALFASQVLETTWVPIYLFFFLQALGIALLMGWFLRTLPGVETAPPATRALTVAAGAVVGLSPITYEIVYWPTCMAYALGALLMALAAWANTPVWRWVLLLLSFLLYESFILPALAMLCLRGLVDYANGRRPSWSNLPWPRVGVWFAALVATLLVRSLAAVFVGPYHHKTLFSLFHIAWKWVVSFKELFLVPFYGSGTNLVVSLVQWFVILVAIGLAWKRLSRTALCLFAACFLSTAVYWVLEYPAIRAVYGSQIVFLAALGWLILQPAAEFGKRKLVAGALVFLLVGYVQQSLFIMRIKTDNARIMAASEAGLARRIARCESPCLIHHGNLNQGLEDDWVLPPDYWRRYFEYLSVKHGRGKQIRFQQVRGFEVN